jgi:hypothetical protein
MDLVLNECSRLQKNLHRPIKILDLGAGPGRYWKSEKLSEFLISTKSELTLFDATTEFDGEKFPDGALVNRKKGILPEDLKLISDNYYDFVLAIDLIEHLPKYQGYKLLYEIDRISAGSSGLVTPNGFVWQPPSRNNEYNAHVSGWTFNEFKSLGWNEVRGQIGLRYLYGPYSLQKYKGKSNLKLEMIALAKILSFYFPRLSFSMYAQKKKKNPRILDHE